MARNVEDIICPICRYSGMFCRCSLIEEKQREMRKKVVIIIDEWFKYYLHNYEDKKTAEINHFKISELKSRIQNKVNKLKRRVQWK